MQSRRDFLKLGSAAALGGGAFITGGAQAAQQWNFEHFLPIPERHSWRVIDLHDSGYVTPEWLGRHCYSPGRVEFSSPDGLPCYCHVVSQGEEVHPLGIDSPVIPVNFSSFDRVLMRYHHWVENPSGIEGKWMGLELGRGWIGVDHPRPSNALFGSDGAGVNTMHPERDGANGIRLLASLVNQDSPYGENIGEGKNIVPNGRWFTVDVIVERDAGYRLYVDGALEAQREGKPMENWNACKAIWYRNRMMHGGTPSKLPAHWDYREWLGGFFIAVS